MLIGQSSFLINSRPLLYDAWKRKKEKLTNVHASSSAQLLWFTAAADFTTWHIRKTGSPRKKSVSPLAFVPGAWTFCCLQLLLCTHEVSTSPPEGMTPWRHYPGRPGAGAPVFDQVSRTLLVKLYTFKRVTDALWPRHFVVLWTGPPFPPPLSRETLNTPLPSPPFPSPNRALSSALFGPDSAALRRTVWFCCRVSIFDCRSYLNRKEIRILYVLESMSVDSTSLCFGRFHIEFAGRQQAEKLIQAEQRAFDMSFLLNRHVEPCCLVLCRTKQGRKPCTRQSSRGGGGGYLGSCLFYPLFFLLFSSLFSVPILFLCRQNFSKIMNIRFKA